MDPNLLDGLGGKPGASDSAIEQAETELGWKMPQDYRDFLLKKNGGEGLIGDNYLILWSAEDLAQFNKDYEVLEYAPGLILIGSDGGGEGFAFDVREKPAPIVQVPFIGMALEYATVIAPDFDSFIKRMNQ
jgi:cell wall assembly regulator SMI1